MENLGELLCAMSKELKGEVSISSFVKGVCIVQRVWMMQIYWLESMSYKYEFLSLGDRTLLTASAS